jgi:hypothetical protein
MLEKLKTLQKDFDAKVLEEKPKSSSGTGRRPPRLRNAKIDGVCDGLTSVAAVNHFSVARCARNYIDVLAAELER